MDDVVTGFVTHRYMMLGSADKHKHYGIAVRHVAGLNAIDHSLETNKKILCHAMVARTPKHESTHCNLSYARCVRELF